MNDLFMVFDVESIGLHGEGFAWGYVVIDRAGVVQHEDWRACDPDSAAGGDEGRAWVSENCPRLYPNSDSPYSLRMEFWAAWRLWKERGAVLVADCQWPVEARFLLNCVDDNAESRQWEGPYPLHELASFMVAAGMDPMATYDRFPAEWQHHPLGDARQSARLLVAALESLP